MVIENKNYSDLFNKIENIKNETLNTKLTIGKHRGETLGEVLDYDRQYIYWLIRETNISIDPRLLGLKMPTKNGILELLDLTFEDNKFNWHQVIVHPAKYDTWNLGHYGCTSPECIEKETIESHDYTYSFDELIDSSKGEILKRAYPYIKWTKEYLVSLFNN